MKKWTKRLLSSLTAGLFVLQSIPLISIGSSAAGTTVLKYTPTIDGKLDKAYSESYSYSLEKGNMKLLYDLNYVYLYADIKDSTISDDDYIEYTLVNTDSTVFWSDSDVYRFYPNTGTATILFSWRDAGDNTVKDEELANSEFAIVLTDTGYTVEARIARAIELTEGRNDLRTNLAINDDGTITGTEWLAVYQNGDGDVLTLGVAFEAPPADESTVVKKFTPELDGEMDDQYMHSASINTVDFAKSGKIQIGMEFMTIDKKVAWLDAGIFDEDGNLSADGDYSIAEFPKGEIYFLWDNDAIYVFSKIYDDEIMTLDAEQTAAIGLDCPWLMDGIANIINPESNQFAEITAYGIASGTAMWDHANAGWSSLGNFVNVSADKRLEDAENIKTVVNSDEGYYTIEMRIPISEQDFGGTPLKDSFLQDGKTFTYQFRITDSHGGGMQSVSSPLAGYFYQNTADNKIEFTLSSEAPSNEHIWDTEYTVDTPATCTVPGSESIHCVNCGAIKEDSVREIPTIPHNYKDGVCTECGAEMPEFEIGDVNGDGVINVLDLSRLMNNIASENSDLAGDVNGDGKVNVLDLSRLMNIIANSEE